MIFIDPYSKLATKVGEPRQGWIEISCKCMGKCGFVRKTTARAFPPGIKKLLATIYAAHLEIHFALPEGWILSRCNYAGCPWAVVALARFYFCQRCGHETNLHQLSPEAKA